MTREEQIQEAKDKAFPIPKEGRSYESAWAAGGFEMGVHWADEHPINVWHDVSEEPQGDEWEVLCEADGCYLTTDPWTLAWKVGQSWEKYVRVNSVKRWLYISDLLPKGGER